MALNERAFKEAEGIKDLMADTTDKEKKTEQDGTTKLSEVPVQATLGGPYGGSVDLGDYECVLLLAGGAGAHYWIIVGR